MRPRFSAPAEAGGGGPRAARWWGRAAGGLHPSSSLPQPQVALDHALVVGEVRRGPLACNLAGLEYIPRSPRSAAPRGRFARPAGSPRRSHAARRIALKISRTISGARPRLGSSSISTRGRHHQRPGPRRASAARRPTVVLAPSGPRRSPKGGGSGRTTAAQIRSGSPWASRRSR